VLRRLKDKTFGKGHVARILCERSFAGAQDDRVAVRVASQCERSFAGAQDDSVWRSGWHLSVKDPSLALRMTERALRMAGWRVDVHGG